MPHMFRVSHRKPSRATVEKILEMEKDADADWCFVAADLPGQGYTSWFESPDVGPPFTTAIEKEVERLLSEAKLLAPDGSLR